MTARMTLGRPPRSRCVRGLVSALVASACAAVLGAEVASAQRGNLLVKVATAPFAALGRLFGGSHGEDMKYIDFAPGSADLRG